MAHLRLSGDPLLRRTLGVEYCTIAFGAAEAIGALVSGFLAGSVALEAFGVDSLIEIVSAFIVLGELRVLASGATPDPQRRHRDHRALALLFFALIAYVLALTGTWWGPQSDADSPPNPPFPNSDSQPKEPILLQTTIVLLVALILAAGVWPSLLDMLKWGRL